MRAAGDNPAVYQYTLNQEGNLKEIWIVKGKVSCPEAWTENGYDAVLGQTEWQFSDGPPNERGSSDDYLDIEKGLRDHSGSVFYFCD